MFRKGEVPVQLLTVNSNTSCPHPVSWGQGKKRKSPFMLFVSFPKAGYFILFREKLHQRVAKMLYPSGEATWGCHNTQPANLNSLKQQRFISWLRFLFISARLLARFPLVLPSMTDAWNMVLSLRSPSLPVSKEQQWQCPLNLPFCEGAKDYVVFCQKIMGLTDQPPSCTLLVTVSENF